MLKTLRFIWTHPLNEQGRLSALGRFFRWQIVSRLAPGRTKVPFVGETRLFMRKGMTGATGNYYCGLHEPDEMGFVLHLLRPGDLFLDVGANIGSYSILAGGIGARVLSIEPIPETFRLLEDNVALNRLTHLVECRCLGIADQSGMLKFTSGLDTMNHIIDENDVADGIEVPVETIDSILQGRCPTLVKIDVEGHEARALAGARTTLRDQRLQAIILETNGLSDRLGHGPAELTETLREAGFAIHHYDAVQRELRPGPRGNNSIFVRDADAIRDRLTSSRRHTIVNGSI